VRDRPAVLVALVLLAGGLIAYAVLRNSGDSESESAPATTAARTLTLAPETATETETGTVAETQTETETETQEQTHTQTQTRTRTQTQTQTVTTEKPGSFHDVIGTDYRLAVGRLLADRLLPDTYPAPSSHPRGLVIAQSPAVGAHVEPGTGVQLTVSLGRRGRPQRTVPDLKGLRLAQAIRACAVAAFTCRTENPRGRRFGVTGQQPAAGRTLPALTQIVLTTTAP
jgi:beta-lactam-binding protein with PASTA domain